jgi:prophage regulatory protein
MNIGMNSTPHVSEQIVTRQELQKRLRKGKSTLYRWIQNGDFPAPRRLGPGSVGWLESEINQWIRSRPRVDRR